MFESSFNVYIRYFGFNNNIQFGNMAQHSTSMSDIFGFNNNIQFGNMVQLFYRILCASRSIQKDDSHYFKYFCDKFSRRLEKIKENEMKDTSYEVENHKCKDGMGHILLCIRVRMS